MQPGEGWPLHDVARTPPEPDDDYLVPPDPAIGRVLSACTNKRRDGLHKANKVERGHYALVGILAFVFAGIFGIIGGQFLGRAIAGQIPFGYEIEGALPWVFGLGAAIFATLAGLLLVRLLRRPAATWVGERGLARYKRGLFAPSHEVLRFEEAGELRSQRVRQFVNGAYTGTTYTYTWRDPRGRVLFKIHGQYNDLQTPIGPREPVQFAWAAEEAWSAFRYPVFARQIAQEGFARFPVGAGDFIHVGSGFIELGSRGKTERLSREEIADIYFERGALVVKRHGAREGFFSSDGVFRFSVGAMNDFQVFLRVLSEQTGIRFR